MYTTIISISCLILYTFLEETANNVMALPVTGGVVGVVEVVTGGGADVNDGVGAETKIDQLNLINMMNRYLCHLLSVGLTDSSVVKTVKNIGPLYTSPLEV